MQRMQWLEGAVELDCFTSHVGEHSRGVEQTKKAGNSLLFQNTHSAAVPGRGNAFCLRHVGDARHVGDGRVYPVFIWTRHNWIGAS